MLSNSFSNLVHAISHHRSRSEEEIRRAEASRGQVALFPPRQLCPTRINRKTEANLVLHGFIAANWGQILRHGEGICGVVFLGLSIEVWRNAIYPSGHWQLRR
jgi:hypothetical protein